MLGKGPRAKKIEVQFMPRLNGHLCGAFRLGLAKLLP